MCSIKIQSVVMLAVDKPKENIIIGGYHCGIRSVTISIQGE